MSSLNASSKLTSPAIRDLLGHDEVRNLFLWHALEESEHKAVAFDVYRAVGGSERTRVIMMNLQRFGFVVGMSVTVIIGLLGDGATYRDGNLRRSIRAFRGSPVPWREVWATLKDYNRPDFHPDDRDSTELVHLHGQCGAETFDDRHLLEGKRALEELPAVQSAAEDEMALQQRAGLAEQLQRFLIRHGHAG